MQRSVVTQVDFKELKYALDILSNNLSTHVNASLAKAHGINIVAGYTDTVGNDLSTYQDAHGDIWGNRFLRITVPDVGVFYAPATVVDPVTVPGKTPVTGSVDSTFAAPFDFTGGTGWVTEFASEDTAIANSINQGSLLPHLALAHWETHGGMTVYAKNTFNTPGGNLVAEYVAQITIDGAVYEIPCSKRFGGPFQPIRSLGSIPTSRSVNIGEGQGNTVNITLSFTVPQGTKPFTYQWQYFNTNTATWTNMTTSSFQNIPGWDNGIGITGSSTLTNALHIISVFPGSDQARSVQLRCLVTNPAGSTNTNICTLTAKDETGSWIIKEVMKHRVFTSAQIFNIHKLRAWGFKHRNDETHFYTGPYGKKLVERMRSANYDFSGLLPLVEFLLSKESYENRYEKFRKLILDSIHAHWPDCDHPVWLRYKPQYV